MEETTKRNYDEGYYNPNDTSTELQIEHKPESKFLSFHGNGMDLFKINIVNLLLSLITLGLYYPWAKATRLKYVYSNTEFKNSRFSFLGTGKEMFQGYIKVYLGLIVFIALLVYSNISGNHTLFLITYGVLYFVILLILPFAIHGALKYRMSRSSWRSIRFGYRGDAMEFFKKFMGGALLTIITLGIYASWFRIEMNRYIYSKMRFGDVEMRYRGDGGDLFVLNLKGTILTYMTCFIYFFWYQKELFEYNLQNTDIIQNGKTIRLNTHAEGLDFVELNIINFLLLIFTLGLAAPWVYCRTINFYLQHTLMAGDIDENALQQTEAKYTNATGEDVLDTTDLDLGFMDF
jgi:uncharacterized membrane protein YjgN (DUF898 family)